MCFTSSLSTKCSSCFICTSAPKEWGFVSEISGKEFVVLLDDAISVNAYIVCTLHGHVKLG